MNPNKDQLERERQMELPGISFLAEQNRLQAKDGHGYIDENPEGSQIWTKTALKDNYAIPGSKCHQRCHQCQHGLKDENGIPIKKATSFDSNIRLRRTCIVCTGCRDKHGKRIKHSTLEGKHNGIARTARAAVYVPHLCRAILRDILAFISGLSHFHSSTALW